MTQLKNEAEFALAELERNNPEVAEKLLQFTTRSFFTYQLENNDEIQSKVRNYWYGSFDSAKRNLEKVNELVKEYAEREIGKN